MATFVHLADLNDAKRIRRAGLRATRVRPDFAKEIGARSVVFCTPVVPDFHATFQWLRELRRRGVRTLCAVQFRIPDSEPVLIGRYNEPHRQISAAEAVQAFLLGEIGQGGQVVVRRAVAPREIVGLRGLRQIVGWRFYPEAKGQRSFYIQKGEIDGRRLRRLVEEREAAGFESMDRLDE